MTAVLQANPKANDTHRAIEALRSVASNFASNRPLHELLCVTSARVAAELCKGDNHELRV